MKVMLVDNYCGLLPDVLTERLKGDLSNPRTRVDEGLIKFIEGSAIPYDKDTHTEKWFSSNIDKLVYKVLDGSMRYYFGYRKEGKYGFVCRVSIVEVDTGRRWTIVENDDFESIKYIDDVECKDEELNYWSRV